MTPENHLVKFAHDTYLIVPASNVDSRSIKMNNIDMCAAANSLVLNRAKFKEIIESRRKRPFVLLSSLPGVVCDISVKFLRVYITDSLSASDHVRGVISNSAQTTH